MLFSMTGYSAETMDLVISKGKIVSVTIEIKSLNSRFFELTTRLSKNLTFLETDIYSTLRKKLIRGRIYCSIQPTTAEGEIGAVIPSLKIAQGYLDAANTIKQKLGVRGEITISDMLALPSVFDAEKPIFTGAAKKNILLAVEKVADQVIKERMNEGDHLKKDIEKRFSLCEKSLEKVSIMYEKLMVQQKNLISKTSQSLESGDESAKGKLEDLYSMLNKIDIHEEITRFQSHLSTVKSLILGKEIEKGKRLDFMLQELVRETNTIAAKCSNADISKLAVDIKVELEKVREQSQNVL